MLSGSHCCSKTRVPKRENRDPNNRLQADSSSESSDDDDDDYYDSVYGEHPQVFRDIFSTMADDEFQPVANKRSQSNALIMANR